VSKAATSSSIEWAEEYARRLRNELGDQLDSLVLYDWVFGEKSDEIEDVQVVVITKTDSSRVRDRVFDAALRLESERDYAAVTTAQIYSADALKTAAARHSPLELEMLAKARVIYDDGFFTSLRRAELSQGGADAE
jgi:hypothetical protein